MSEQTTHTPGPWELAVALPMAVTVFADSARIADVERRKDPQRTLANARLIAAAPELLAACNEFVRKCECGEARSSRSYAQMKAAIAKAEGRDV